MVIDRANGGWVFVHPSQLVAAGSHHTTTSQEKKTEDFFTLTDMATEIYMMGLRKKTSVRF